MSSYKQAVLFGYRTYLAPHLGSETCCACGGTVKVIACIEELVVIEKTLTHPNGKSASAGKYSSESL
jgi:hypothetical protein